MQTKRILVVDDQEDVQALARVSLERLGGWQVVSARSGAEGISAARNEQPDAILLDLMMPDMDGTATFRQLQSDPVTQHIPVILLTARAESTDDGQFASLGVAAVIPKPFDPLTLARQVAHALGWAHGDGNAT